MKKYLPGQTVKSGDSPKWTRVAILLSAFGIGNYKKESDDRYKAVMGEAVDGLNKSEAAIKASEAILNR